MAPPLLPLRHYAPPSHVTEDTPPDLLEGTMDLEVTLPNGQTVIMSVHRSTPMMDLLIQVTTAHRINPGGHVIQVISDNIFLSYKPSTPIGTLDTNAIKIVAKNTLNEKAKTRKSNLQQQAIERNIRLKPKEWVYKQQLVVNLPRNQLAVYRVRPKALISEIFTMVCDDKNLDPDVHEIRHPVNVDERLRGSCSLSDYQLQEVCVVSSDFRPPPLSVTDLITMSSIAHPEDKKRRGIFGLFSRKAKSSTGDSSLSSGSAGERSVSPARSDESNEGRPTPPAHSPNSSSGTLTNNNHKTDTSRTSAASSQRNSFNSVNSSSSQISRPVSMISLNKNKKRQAPVPPQRVKRTTEGRVVNNKSNDSKEKPSLSRHSSDSSGYHEQEIRSSYTSPSNSEVSSFEVTRNSIPPTTNLTSMSSSSMSSLKGGKRKAPCPPKPPLKNGIEGPVSIPESPEENESNESLKGDHESDRRSIASSSVGKPSSEVNGDEYEVRNDETEDNCSRVSLSKDKKVENMTVDAESLPPSPKPEHSSPITMESKVIEKNTVEESEEFSSLDTNSLPKSNESVEDDNHNESKDVKTSVLNSNEKSDVELLPYSTETYESPLPSLVMSEFTSNKLSSQTHKAMQPKTCEITEESRALWKYSLAHPESELTAFSPNQTGNELNTTQSMSTTPKPNELEEQAYGHLMFDFPDRLNQDDISPSFSKTFFDKDLNNDPNAVTSDSKMGTFPRTVKNKLRKIIPKFATLSRLQNKTYNPDKNPQQAYFSRTLDSNGEKENAERNNLKVDITTFQDKVKPAKYHFVMKSSNDISQQNPKDLTSGDENHIAVESIFQNASNYETFTVRPPIPTPRSKNNEIDEPSLNNYDNLKSLNMKYYVKAKRLSASKLDDVPAKDNSSVHLFPNQVNKKDSFGNSSFIVDELISSIDENNYRTDNDPLTNNRETCPIKRQNIPTYSADIVIDGRGGEFDEKKISPKKYGNHDDIGSSLTSSHHQGSLNSSLISDAENEIPQTVSLSSETSDACLEMLNPMDIQRPKRHKRKGIPESFMINPNFVDDTSNSSHPHKNFESVNEVEEYAREYEENNSVEENLQILARSSAQLTEGLNGTTEDSEGRNLSSDAIISDIARTSRLSVIYVEDVNEEESTTDPVTPPTERRQIFTSKVQLSSTSENDNLTSFPTRENSVPDHRSVSITQITSVEEKQTPKQDISKSDVIAELKSAIESSDENSDLQPRILNFKPKEKSEWHYGRPSDYNLILNFKKKPDSPNDSPFNRSASISSYESVDNNNSFRKRSSTETSYESAPPPPPDSRPPPFNSDGDSKTSSSVASRQSSFNDNDSVDFIKPRVPAFSIATYQNRASKISYDKKLSRSESLVSFKDLQTNEDGKSSETKKLARSDSQRNEIFKSDSLKKSTSTTFLNQNNSSTEYSDKIANTSNVRPSLIKSQSRSSLYENGPNQPQNGTIQFDISSSKEPITFNRTLPNTYSNLRKAKSSLDIRGNDGRMTDGFQTIPDSGLASEYMRLQDDFMKWQHQLLQNQQLLHNRVAPIASNPPVLNNTGLVNTMVNPTPTNAHGMAQRKPVEITIPIKFEDSDEESPNEAQSRAYSKPVVQKPISQNPPSTGPRWVGPPNVSVDSWQERPSYVVMPQPIVIEPQLPRPFESQPRMQTIFQSAPQETVLPSNSYYQSPQPIQQKPIFQSAPQETVLPSNNYYQSPQPIQQKPQPIFQQQNVRTHIQQNPTRPEFQQAQPSPIIPQVPQPNFQRPSRNEVQPIPQNNFRQGPQSRYQQPLQPSIDPQTSEVNFQQFPEPETQFTTKSFPQYSSRPQISSNATPFVNDKNDDGINARFSSVVTLSNDKNDKNPVQKDKVRSVVQLNNSDNPFESHISTPFNSKILNNAPKMAENVEKENNGTVASPAGSPFAAPMSSRLVQQAVQQPSAGGFRISPPKIERYSPSRVERSSPPQIERKYSPQMDRQPSPFKHEASPPFGDVKLRHVETRESPPRSEVPQPPAPPPPPPPPSMNAPPPPPPPPMSEAERRTATGKKIFGAANVPQLDAREELMMAIRQFGGSGKLRRSGHPINS